MSANIRMTIAYDGTRYLGWQKTKMGPSIEGELQKALETIFQTPFILQAASRTDAGVHAKGQVVNFISPKAITDFFQLKKSLNSLLPPDISVLEIHRANDSFHPTLDCIGKEYRYQVCTGKVQLPQHRFYSWHYYYLVDLDLMRQASSLLIGKHDFAAFCNTQKNDPYVDTEREIFEIEILVLPEERLCFRISGNRFLYKMVRNLVGTILYAGCGKIDLDAVSDIIALRKRPMAGMTAPAHGLTLWVTNYR